MFTQMRLRNFKSWADTGPFVLKPITGLFGTNSSGKTSLLQALLLMKQTSESSDRNLVLHFGDKTTPVNLGDLASVLYTHNVDSLLSLEFEWSTPEPFVVKDTKKKNRTVVSDSAVRFSVDVRATPSSRDGRMAVQRMLYAVGEAEFFMERNAKGKSDYHLGSSSSDFTFIHSVGRKWPLPAPVRSYGFPDQVRAYFQNAGFLADLELAFEERLRSLYYLGPLRAYPERRYTWAGAQPTDVGRAGESVVDALLASAERGEKISRGAGRKRVTLQEYVAEWLKKLGLIHEFRVRPIAEGSQVFQVVVKRTADAPEVLITDVGFGVSQILPVLVLCFYVPEGSTIILEQPEIHLHPSVQAGLADVLIDAWQKRSVQIILESHSEHLLRRLQRRVAEEEVTTNDIGLYFCMNEKGGSRATPLHLDLFGSIQNWPEGFFGDEFGEIAAITEARMRRKMD